MTEKNRFDILIKWLVSEKVIVSRIYLLAILQGIIYLLVPLGIQAMVTYVMAGRFSSSLVLLSSCVIAAVAFIGVFQIWQMRIAETLHERIYGSVVSRISEYIKHQKPDRTKLQKLNYYFEVISLQKGIGKILMEFSFAVISIIFGLLILPLYSPWFLLFTLLLSAVFVLIILYYGKKGMDTSLRVSDKKYQFADWIQQKVLDSQESEPTSVSADKLLDGYINERKGHYLVLESQFKGIFIFKVLFIATLLLLGAYLVQRGQLNIGQFVASEIIVFLVINSVEKLVSSLGTFYDTITSLIKLEKLFSVNEDLSLLSKKTPMLPANLMAYSKTYPKAIRILLSTLGVACFSILFMPWTQSIDGKGKVSSLDPSMLPQTVNTRIAGRIEKWFIQEGQVVTKNDTIAFISEVKDEYMDPRLLDRSAEQIDAKESSILSYEQKVNAINKQIDALNSGLGLKLDQARNKINQVKAKLSADSMDFIASSNNFELVQEQYVRYEELQGKGVISKTDLENRNMKVQEALAKKTAAANKIIATRNELSNSELELSTIEQEYSEKLMKAESDKFSTMTMLFEGEGALSKMQNQLTNYRMRRSSAYVLAPQDGFITKTNFQGVGEIVKEGDPLCTIVPKDGKQSIEFYVRPMDLPLIQIGSKVQVVFDGWPAFAFSGWPGISYGTYEAEIVSFDKTLSENGQFRVLARASKDPWPSAIQIGSGVKVFALLKDVPVFYEIWRNINGFPPEFYASEKKTEQSVKK